jgi:hypothetical protein
MRRQKSPERAAQGFYFALTGLSIFFLHFPRAYALG